MTKRFDWRGTFGKISTWLGLLAAMGTPGLAAYAMMPDRAQNLMPDWFVFVMAAMVMLPALLIPAATAFKQKRFDTTAKVEVTKETTNAGDGEG